MHALAGIIQGHEDEAARLEAAMPVLEAQRLAIIRVSQGVVDPLEAAVEQSDVDRERWLDQVGVDAETAAKLLPALKARELALVSLFSDRVLDAVDEMRSKAVAAAARSKALREQAELLKPLLVEVPSLPLQVGEQIDVQPVTCEAQEASAAPDDA